MRSTVLFSAAAVLSVLCRVRGAALRGGGSSAVGEIIRLVNESVQYESSGSGEGLRKIRSDEFHWAGTEIPLSAADHARAAERGNVLHILPLAYIPVALVFKVPDQRQEYVRGLTFSREALARIFSFDIRYWDHELLRALNRGVALPHQRIRLVARGGSSGITGILTRALTSFGWQRYAECLSAQCQESGEFDSIWNGTASRGVRNYTLAGDEDSLVQHVEENNWTLGYCSVPEGLQAKRGVAIATVLSRYGRPTAPSGEGVLQSVREVVFSDHGSNFTADAHDLGGYPLIGLAYIVINVMRRDTACETTYEGLIRMLLDVFGEKGLRAARRRGMEFPRLEVVHHVLGGLGRVDCGGGVRLWGKDGLSDQLSLPMAVWSHATAKLMHVLGLWYRVNLANASDESTKNPLLMEELHDPSASSPDNTFQWRQEGEGPDLGDEYAAVPVAAYPLVLVVSGETEQRTRRRLHLDISTVEQILSGSITDWSDPRLQVGENRLSQHAAAPIVVCGVKTHLDQLLGHFRFERRGWIKNDTDFDDSPQVGRAVSSDSSLLGVVPLSTAQEWPELSQVHLVTPQIEPGSGAVEASLDRVEHAFVFSGKGKGGWSADLRRWDPPNLSKSEAVPINSLDFQRLTIVYPFYGVIWVYLRKDTDSSSGGVSTSVANLIAGFEVVRWMTDAYPHRHGHDDHIVFNGRPSVELPDRIQLHEQASAATLLRMPQVAMVPLGAHVPDLQSRVDGIFAELRIDGVPVYGEAPHHDANPLVYVFTAVGGFVAILVIGGFVKHRRDSRNIRRLLSDNDIAETSAECIADMRLEEMAYLWEIESPNRLQRAFIKIMEALLEYKSYLPSSLVAQHAAAGADDAQSRHEQKKAQLLPHLGSDRARAALQCLIAQTEGPQRAAVEELLSERVKACVAAEDMTSARQLLKCGWDPPPALCAAVGLSDPESAPARLHSVRRTLAMQSQGNLMDLLEGHSVASERSGASAERQTVGNKVTSFASGRFGDGADIPANALATVPIFPPGYDAPQAAQVVTNMRLWHCVKGNSYWPSEAVDALEADHRTCHSAVPEEVEGAPALYVYTASMSQPVVWAVWLGSRWSEFANQDERARPSQFKSVHVDIGALLAAGVDCDPHGSSCAELLHETPFGLRAYGLDAREPLLLRYENTQGGDPELSPLRDAALWAASPDRMVSPESPFSLTREVPPPPPGVCEFITSRDFHVRIERGGWLSAPVALDPLTRLREACLAQKNQQRYQERICRHAQSVFSPDASQCIGFGCDAAQLAAALPSIYRSKCPGARPSPAQVAHATELGLLQWQGQWLLLAFTSQPRCAVPIAPDGAPRLGDTLWRIDCEYPDQPYSLINQAMRHQQAGDHDALLFADSPHFFVAGQPASPPAVPAPARFAAPSQTAVWTAAGWEITHSSTGTRLVTEVELYPYAWGLPQFRALIWVLDRALRALPASSKARRKGYRGIAQVTLDRRLYARGNVVVFGAFTSTSADQGVASGFAAGDERAAIFTMYGLTGRVIANWSRYGREKEVLYPPNTLHLVTEALSAEHADILDRQKLQLFDLREVSTAGAFTHLAKEAALEVAKEHPGVLGQCERAGRLAEAGDWVGAARELLTRPEAYGAAERRFAMPVLPHHSVGVIALVFNSPTGPEVGAGIEVAVWNDFFEQAQRLATEHGARLVATHTGGLLLQVGAPCTEAAARAALTVATELLALNATPPEPTSPAFANALQPPPRTPKAQELSPTSAALRNGTGASYELNDGASTASDTPSRSPRQETSPHEQHAGTRPLLLSLTDCSKVADPHMISLCDSTNASAQVNVPAPPSPVSPAVGPRGGLRVPGALAGIGKLASSGTVTRLPSFMDDTRSRSSAGKSDEDCGNSVRSSMVGSLGRRSCASNMSPGLLLTPSLPNLAPGGEKRRVSRHLRKLSMKSGCGNEIGVADDGRALLVHCGVSVGTVHTGFAGCSGQRVEIADGPAVRRARCMAAYSLRHHVVEVMTDGACARAAASAEFTSWTTDLVAFEAQDGREPIVSLCKLGTGMDAQLAARLQDAWTALQRAGEEGADAAAHRHMQECVAAVGRDVAHRSYRALRSAAGAPTSYCYRFEHPIS